jgi:hypothetical protein
LIEGDTASGKREEAMSETNGVADEFWLFGYGFVVHRFLLPPPFILAFLSRVAPTIIKKVTHELINGATTGV